MKKEITLGQLIAVLGSFVITITTGWITMSNKISQQEIEIKNLQQRQDKIENAIFTIQSDVRLILIKMEDKKDR